MESRIKERIMKTTTMKRNWTTNHPRIAKMWDRKSNGIMAKKTNVNDKTVYKWTCPHCGKTIDASIRSMLYTKKACDCGYNFAKLREKEAIKNQLLHENVKNVKAKKSKKSESVAVNYPEVAAFFDESANGCKVSEVYPWSTKAFTFKCSHGHTFIKKMCYMTSSFINYGKIHCPICKAEKKASANKKHKTPFELGRSLAQCYPEIAKYFDQVSNGCTAEEVYCGTNQKYFFKCEEGHSFEMSILDIRKRMRRHGKFICPVCHPRWMVPKRENSLGARYPEIAEMFDEQVNKRSVWETYPKSSQVFAFICKDEHRFTGRLSELTNKYDKNIIVCPICRRLEASLTEAKKRTNAKLGKLIVDPKRVRYGENDLFTQFPQAAKKFDPLANGCYAHQVAGKSSQVANWICDVNPDHKWKAKISSMSSTYARCPICHPKSIRKGKKILPDVKTELDTQEKSTLVEEQKSEAMIC